MLNANKALEITKRAQMKEATKKGEFATVYKNDRFILGSLYKALIDDWNI